MSLRDCAYICNMISLLRLLGNSPVTGTKDLQFSYKMSLLSNGSVCGIEIEASQELKTEDSLFVSFLSKMKLFRPDPANLTGSV